MTISVALSDDIELRVIRESDAAAVASAYRANREHLEPWEPVRPHEFFTDRWWADESARLLTLKENGALLPLVLIDGDEVIGRVTVSGIVRGAFQSASLGYWIDARYTGRGITTEAVLAVVGIARQELGLHRLEAGTLLDNEASQRVLLKAGFEPFGVAPRYLQIAGRWQDHRLFQLILHD